MAATLVRWSLLAYIGIVLVGCGPFRMVPKDVPPQVSTVTNPLTGTTVALLNAQEGSEETLVLLPDGRESGYVANRREWCDRLIAALGIELRRASSTITPAGTAQLSFAISNIQAVWSPALLRVTLDVQVTAATGWAKTYTGSAAASTWMSDIPTRAATYAVHEAVKAMLEDAAFLSAVRGK